MTREPTHRIYVHNRKRRRENTVLYTLKEGGRRRRVGQRGEIDSNHTQHRETERDRESWTALVAASCLIHYLKADHMGKTLEHRLKIQTSKRERERERVELSFDLFTFWLFVADPASSGRKGFSRQKWWEKRECCCLEPSSKWRYRVM